MACGINHTPTGWVHPDGVFEKRRILVFSFLVMLSIPGIRALPPDPVRIMVITGGHEFNRESFEQLFASLGEGFSYSIEELPDAFNQFRIEKREEYDVLVFYHMWQTIGLEQQEWMTDCIRKGKPLVVLHHSICAFDGWPEYIRMIGGKYFHAPTEVDGTLYPASSYEHDRQISLILVDSLHPVTRGLRDFKLLDETYKDFYVSPHVNPLLTTKDTTSTSVIGWVNQYGNSPVVVIQSGHDTPTYKDENFRKLLRQAISWVYQETH